MSTRQPQRAGLRRDDRVTGDRPQIDVIVIGGGCCGLACAAALAGRGRTIAVLERRLDPDSAEGRVAIGRAATLLDQANALEQRSGGATAAARALLVEARHLRADYWGGQARNVILDSHSVAALEGLGAATGRLPRIERFALNGPPGGPTFTAHLAHRALEGERDALSAVRLLWQRDWTVLAPLGAIERVLRERCEALADVQLHFGATVLGIEQYRDRIAIATGEGTLEAGFAIVADGGGRHSTLAALGVARTVHHRERLSLAVRASDPSHTVLGHDSTDVFSVNGLTADGWLGLFGNGTAVSAVINRTGMLSGAALDAATALQEAGLATALVEPPIAIVAEIAQADTVMLGPHIAFAGDAVLSGNPRIGLGVQFGLLWAQQLAAMIDDRSDRLRLDTKSYARVAAAICAERRDFELAWMAIVDGAIERPERLAEYPVSEPVLAALARFELDATRREQAPTRWRARYRIVLDAARLSPTDDSAVAGFLRALGELRIDADLRLRPGLSNKRRLRLTARLSSKRTLSLQYGAERLLVDEGLLQLRRRRADWQIRLTGAVVQQLSNDRFLTRFPLRTIAIALPDAFLDAVVKQAVERARATHAPPWRLRASLVPGAEVQFGALRLVARGPVVATTTAERAGDLVSRYRLEQGTLEPRNLLEFAEHSALASTRWLSALTRLTGGLAAPLIEGAARVAATAVQGLEVRMRRDGSAVATIDAALPITVALDRAEAARLTGDLLAAPALAAAASEQLGAVRAFEFVLTPPA
jgi:2-polyprenyl-6-methoxyphenol hydroxylase-like FAD-dependent oxidoreductase